MLNYQDKVFVKLEELYGSAPPNPVHSGKHGSPPPLYSEWDEVFSSNGLKNGSIGSIGLHDAYFPHEVSITRERSSRNETPTLPTPRKQQPPIGISRPFPFTTTGSTRHNATFPQATISSGRERASVHGQVTPVTTTSSPPSLPPTSMLGRYQAQRRSLLPEAKGHLSANVTHGGHAVVDLVDPHVHRHTAEFVRNDDEILSRPFASHRTNTWLNSSDRVSGLDSSITEPGHSGHSGHGTDARFQLPLNPVPYHDTTITPLHEEPFLFHALLYTERRYTQDLVSDEKVLLARPAPRSMVHPALFLSSQRNLIGNFRAPLQSPHPSHWSPMRPHPFKRHPIPISRHNPFRHPSRYPIAHPAKPAKHGAPATVLQRDSRPLHSHILASPCPKVPNLNMVKYLENLVDDNDDDNDIILYMSSQRSLKHDHLPSLPDHDEQNQDQPVPHGGTRYPNSVSASARKGVINRGLERFLEERRRLSSPNSARYASGSSAGTGVDESKPTPGPFNDFPVCEMSIAMGLHEDTPRWVNVTDQTSHGD